MYLQYSEVLQNTVHHVFLWKVFQSMYKTDHVVTHWRAVDTKYKSSVVKPGVFSLCDRVKICSV